MEDLFHGIELRIISRRIAKLQRLIVVLLSAVQPLKAIQICPVRPGAKQILHLLRVGVRPTQSFLNQHLHVTAGYTVEVNFASVVVNAHNHIVGLRIMLQRIVKDLVGRAAHKQLLLDHEAMRKGLPLRALNTSPASSKKKLITAMAV